MSRPVQVSLILGLATLARIPALLEEPDRPVQYLRAVGALRRVLSGWFSHHQYDLLFVHQNILAGLYRIYCALDPSESSISLASCVAGFFENPRPFLLVGRTWNLVVSVAITYGVFRIGRLVATPAAALVAALLWAICPLAVSDAGSLTVDSTAALAGVLSLYFVCASWQQPTTFRAIASGFFAGLGVATKQSLVLIPACVLVSCFLHVARTGPAEKWPLPLRFFLPGTLAGFLIPNALLFTDLSGFLSVIFDFFRIVRGEKLTDAPTWDPLYYLGAILLATGLLPGLLFFVASLLALWRPPTPQRRFLLSLAWIWITCFSVTRGQGQRYVIPILPVVCLEGAAMATHLREYLLRRANGRTLMASGLLALLILPSLSVIGVGAYYRFRNHKEHYSNEMEAWMNREIPAGSVIAGDLDALPFSVVSYLSLTQSYIPEVARRELLSAGPPLIRRFRFAMLDCIFEGPLCSPTALENIHAKYLALDGQKQRAPLWEWARSHAERLASFPSWETRDRLQKHVFLIRSPATPY